MEKTSDALGGRAAALLPAARISAPAVLSRLPTCVFLSHILSSTTPETLAQVPVAKRNGKQLVLGDVAQLVWGPQGMVGDAVINDGPGLMLIVEKYPWATRSSDPRRRSSFDELKTRSCRRGNRQQDLPARPNHIRRFHRQLSPRTGPGMRAGHSSVFAFLYEVRTALICIVAIPLSLLAAVLVLEWSGLDPQHDGAGRAL